MKREFGMLTDVGRIGRIESKGMGNEKKRY